LRTLLGELDSAIEVTVIGTDAAVVEAISASRPGTATLVLQAVRSRSDLRAIAAHIRAVRRLRPDIFQANLISPWSCRYGLLAAFLTRGTQVIAVEHLPGPATAEFPPRRKRLFSKRLDGHVAVGERTARELEQRIGIPVGSIRVIPNGIRDRRLAPPEQPRPGMIVGSLGRLDTQKGYDVLIEAVPQLPPGTRVVLVGDGPERSSLQSQAERLGVADRVRFVGWREDARDYLATFDLFALPSRFEGLPLAVLEAMLASVPVVAADVGSVAEAVVQGATGVLVPPEDVDALAAALAALLKDADRRAQLGEAGRALALERFTAEAMARRYEELYGELLARSP
jgi:glycosyltransferase involved in cell wall biosynthesis